VLSLNNDFYETIFWVYNTPFTHAPLAQEAGHTLSQAGRTLFRDHSRHAGDFIRIGITRSIGPFSRLQKHGHGIAAPFPPLTLYPEQARPGQHAVPLPGIRPTKNEMELPHAEIL
jgi:hypothetical protein